MVVIVPMRQPDSERWKISMLFGFGFSIFVFTSFFYATLIIGLIVFLFDIEFVVTKVANPALVYMVLMFILFPVAFGIMAFFLSFVEYPKREPPELRNRALFILKHHNPIGTLLLVVNTISKICKGKRSS